MEIVELGTESKIEQLGSHGALWLPLAQSSGECHVGRMRLEPAAVLGMHPAPVDQLFIVVEDQGWTRTEEGQPVSLEAGQVVLWRAGDHHESGTDGGMTAMVVEAEALRLK